MESFVKFSGRTCVNGCPPLSELHGVVSYNRSAVGGRYPVGTKGTYHCDVSLYSGSETRICQRSGGGVVLLHYAVKVRNINYL